MTSFVFKMFICNVSCFNFTLYYLYKFNYEGETFVTFMLVTFVRSSLNLRGDNASADEGRWYLTFYVALFLIHSIWEQVPNTPEQIVKDDLARAAITAKQLDPSPSIPSEIKLKAMGIRRAVLGTCSQML